MRPRFEGKPDKYPRSGDMMLEAPPFRGGQRLSVPMEVAHEIALTIGRDAVPEDEVVHAPANVERVDLHIPMAGERRRYIGVRGCEAERPAEKAAGSKRRYRQRTRRHGRIQVD